MAKKQNAFSLPSPIPATISAKAYKPLEKSSVPSQVECRAAVMLLALLRFFLFAFEIANRRKQTRGRINTNLLAAAVLAERSLWIQERTGPDARGEAGDKNTARVQRCNVQRSSNWARGWRFVKCTWSLPF